MSDTHERRRIILEAAERLLEHYGLNKTTIADIAREAAIGVGTVYLEFGSKNDIIGHVASGKHHTLLAQLEEIANGAGTAEERLQSFLDARVRAFRALASCGTHAPELVHCRCDPVENSWRNYKRAERDLVSRLLSEGAESGEFHVADPERVAASVLDAYAVFVPPSQARVLEDFDERLAAMHTLVLRGIT